MIICFSVLLVALMILNTSVRQTCNYENNMQILQRNPWLVDL